MESLAVTNCVRVFMHHLRRVAPAVFKTTRNDYLEAIVTLNKGACACEVFDSAHDPITMRYLTRTFSYILLHSLRRTVLTDITATTGTSVTAACRACSVGWQRDKPCLCCDMSTLCQSPRRSRSIKTSRIRRDQPGKEGNELQQNT